MAQSGGFSDILVARSGGFSRGRANMCLLFAHKIRHFLSSVGFDMAVLKQRKIDGERRVFQDRSVCLHSTEK